MCGSRRFAESDQTMIGVAYFFESWNNEGARRRLERRGCAFGVLDGAFGRTSPVLLRFLASHLIG